MKLELHQLDEKYADLRVHDATREQRLAASIAEHGQQTPVVVTAGAGERFILLDGHVRVRVLRALGRDDVDAVLLELPEAEALVVSHRLDNTRTRSALEEGWMLRVLVDEHGLRQSDLAAKLDRSESWVSRRLGLVRMLPASVQEAVQKGRVAAQAAQKWLLPLSRDNREQCVRLVENLGRRGASVRELGRLYRGWR
ncbi:ParB/RepB/Spo0J family partition protein [Nannocystis exedens]|uniref:ParB/RepB/Spo0J family partition protein n=1 Tax=Nannocystis exedens TaxID=54 RepID=A0A1I2I7I2_9BACT|nr:ParB/RepB/Spo0J family partition protein [Nannocystis exedens]PCC74651.1 nuclease [Nannocystis exedens]SFF37057.1 ParB/RepB/Spo0J family partition protein [Nannocystis exedens]